MCLSQMQNSVMQQISKLEELCLENRTGQEITVCYYKQRYLLYPIKHKLSGCFDCTKYLQRGTLLYCMETKNE